MPRTVVRRWVETLLVIPMVLGTMVGVYLAMSREVARMGHIPIIAFGLAPYVAWSWFRVLSEEDSERRRTGIWVATTGSLLILLSLVIESIVLGRR